MIEGEASSTNGPSPLDDLPDDVIPEDYKKAQQGKADQPSDLALDSTITDDDLAEMAKGKRELKRLLSRNLYEEVDTMREFLALGLKSAIIRVHNKREATRRQAKFYYARKKQGVLANAAMFRDAENALELSDEVQEFYKLEFEIDRDKKGVYLRIRLKAPLVLEADPEAQ